MMNQSTQDHLQQQQIVATLHSSPAAMMTDEDPDAITTKPSPTLHEFRWLCSAPAGSECERKIVIPVVPLLRAGRAAFGVPNAPVFSDMVRAVLPSIMSQLCPGCGTPCVGGLKPVGMIASRKPTSQQAPTATTTRRNGSKSVMSVGLSGSASTATLGISGNPAPTSLPTSPTKKPKCSHNILYELELFFEWGGTVASKDIITFMRDCVAGTEFSVNALYPQPEATPAEPDALASPRSKFMSSVTPTAPSSGSSGVAVGATTQPPVALFAKIRSMTVRHLDTGLYSHIVQQEQIEDLQPWWLNEDGCGIGTTWSALSDYLWRHHLLPVLFRCEVPQPKELQVPPEFSDAFKTPIPVFPRVLRLGAVLEDRNAEDLKVVLPLDAAGRTGSSSSQQPPQPLLFTTPDESNAEDREGEEVVRREEESNLTGTASCVHATSSSFVYITKFEDEPGKYFVIDMSIGRAEAARAGGGGGGGSSSPGGKCDDVATCVRPPPKQLGRRLQLKLFGLYSLVPGSIIEISTKLPPATNSACGAACGQEHLDLCASQQLPLRFEVLGAEGTVLHRPQFPSPDPVTSSTSAIASVVDPALMDGDTMEETDAEQKSVESGVCGDGRLPRPQSTELSDAVTASLNTPFLLRSVYFFLSQHSVASIITQCREDRDAATTKQQVKTK